MNKKAERKPLRNFLIKRSLQVRILLQVVFVMVMTGVLTTILLAWVYNATSQGGSFYYMSNDVKQDLELTSILGIILPSLITAQLVSFIIVSGIGLFSSRKVAVPIYKIERWAEQLKSGNLNTNLAFREQKEMSDLTRQCNAVSAFYRSVFTDIAEAADGLEEHVGDSPVAEDKLARIRKALGKVAYGREEEESSEKSERVS